MPPNRSDIQKMPNSTHKLGFRRVLGIAGICNPTISWFWPSGRDWLEVPVNYFEIKNYNNYQWRDAADKRNCVFIFKFISREVIKAACHSRKQTERPWTLAGSSLSANNVFEIDLSLLLLAWRTKWHVAFWLASLRLGREEARHCSLSSRWLSQQHVSSCLGHLGTLARLWLLWWKLFGLSSFHLDLFFYFFDEAQQSGIMFRLPLWVNQLLTVSKLDSFARIAKPPHPCNSLQCFSDTRKLLSGN
jgi:hypothetical protein